MSPWLDRLLLGPTRRRRHLERRLRALDREIAADLRRRSRRTRSADPTGWVALVVAVAAVAGMVVVQPTLLPGSLRSLLGLGPDRLAAAPSASGSGTFDFLARQPGSSAPVAYDPCREIAVRVNPDGGPSDAVDLVRDALDEVSRRTGLVLRYDGTTSQRPQWDGESVPTPFDGARGRPVLVSWATADEVGQLRGDVAGIGGSLSVRERDGAVRYVTGGVTLDADSYERLARRRDGEGQMRAILLHELGHLVGLAHVDDPGELMNGDNVGRLEFGPGDLTGLAALGSGSCA